MTATTQAPTTLTYTLFIAAEPERVWQALTDPDLVQQYFYGVRIEVGAGHRRVHGPDGELWGEDPLLECDEPHRLVHSWRSVYDPACADEPESRVAWDIERQDDRTSKLTLTHDQLEHSPQTAAGVAGAGWMLVLSGLKTLLETGRPLGAA